MQHADQVDPLYPVPPQDPIREAAAPGDHINALRQEAFDYVPPTVNKKRGAAVYDTNDQAFGFAVDPTSADEELSHVRWVRFADRQTSSTPHKPHMDIPDVSGIYPHEDEVGPSIGNENNVQPLSHGFVPSTNLDASLAAFASEFKKIKEPKIPKLKGGYSSDAALFFNSWSKDIQACVTGHRLSDLEAIQLVKETAEGGALKEIQFYLDTSPNVSYNGLMSHLEVAYTSGEDASIISRDFYGRVQKPRESEENFADDLQVLARKLIHFRPNFRYEVDNALKQQYASGLNDTYYSSIAHGLLQQHQRASFTEFRSILAKVLGVRAKRTKPTSVTTSAVSGPANNSSNNDANLTKSQKKHHKWKTNTQAIAEIQNKLDAAIAQNQQYQEILKPDALKKVITQAVASSSPPKTQASTNPFNKPYLGKPRPPQMMPGVDGTLDPSLECRYCKDKGHWANNCKKVKLKEE